MLKKLAISIMIFFPLLLINNKAYANDKNALFSPILEDYNAPEYIEFNDYNEMVYYTYNNFLNYKGVVILYSGSGYENFSLDNVTELLFSAMQIDDKNNLNDCEALWGNMASYKRGLSINDGYALICLSLNYKHTKEELDQVNFYIDNVISDLDKKDDFNNLEDIDKSKLLHDYIINHFDYDDTYTNYTEYDAIFNPINNKNVMVCQGYSLLYYKMLQVVGLNSKIIVSDNHSWNLVQINDTWYHVDVTNDDNGIYGDHKISYKYFMKEQLSGKIYDYLSTYFFYENIEKFNLSSNHMPNDNIFDFECLLFGFKLISNIIFYFMLAYVVSLIMKIINSFNINDHYKVAY